MPQQIGLSGCPHLGFTSDQGLGLDAVTFQRACNSLNFLPLSILPNFGTVAERKRGCHMELGRHSGWLVLPPHA